MDTSTSDDDKTSGNRIVYSYRDPNEVAYAQQNQPVASSIINLASPISSESFFARLISAIIEFFKALFGLQ